MQFKSSKEWSPRLRRAKEGALVGGAICLAIVFAPDVFSSEDNADSKSAVDSTVRQDAGCESKVVERTAVSASQIIATDQEKEVAQLPGINKAKDIDKIEFSYDHDAVKNPQEAWDFRDAVADYFNHDVTNLSHRAGNAAVGSLVIYTCG